MLHIGDKNRQKSKRFPLCDNLDSPTHKLQEKVRKLERGNLVVLMNEMVSR